MFPADLHLLSIAALALGIVVALVIGVDVVRHPRMAVMNVVWPVTALFGTVFVLAGYFRYGRASTAAAMKRAKDEDRPMPSGMQPFAALVGKGSLHCGAGCMLGDLVAEWLAFAFPVIAVWFGWHSLFDDRMFAVWILDFIFAFTLGVVF